MLVQALLAVRQSIKRLVGIDSKQCSREWESILSGESVSSLLGEQGELISEPESIYKVMLRPHFDSLRRGIAVEVEEVVIVMLIESVDFVINEAIDGEGVVFEVHLVQLVPHVGEIVLHREEATAHHYTQSIHIS